MRATFLYGAGDVRVADVPDPTIQQTSDAIVRIVRACVCGSDLHPGVDESTDESRLAGLDATQTPGTNLPGTN